MDLGLEHSFTKCNLSTENTGATLTSDSVTVFTTHIDDRGDGHLEYVLVCSRHAGVQLINLSSDPLGRELGDHTNKSSLVDQHFYVKIPTW